MGLYLQREAQPTSRDVDKLAKLLTCVGKRPAVMKHTVGPSTKTAGSSEIMMFEWCGMGRFPGTRRQFASSETLC